MRQTTRVRLTVACAALFLSAAAFAADDWDAFWKSVKVSPSPPRDFLEGNTAPKVRNFTVGRLTDDTARAWVMASLRRGRGDMYAYVNLRRDIADAGIFGPPGLSGTSEAIDRYRAEGVVRMSGHPEPEILAVAVIWISPQMRAENPAAQLTEYVIVKAYRRHVDDRMLVYRDGRSEPLNRSGQPGEIRWQLDAGHFFKHPMLGPLWYQEMGWGCVPNNGTITGEICGRLKP